MTHFKGAHEIAAVLHVEFSRCITVASEIIPIPTDFRSSIDAKSMSPKLLIALNTAWSIAAV